LQFLLELVSDINIYYIFITYILGIVKRNYSLFLHEIEWKNNGFLFTAPNIYTLHIYIYIYIYIAYRKTLFNLCEQLLYFLFAQNISKILIMTLMTL